MGSIATSLMIRCKLVLLKFATKSFNVLLARTRPLVTKNLLVTRQLVTRQLTNKSPRQLVNSSLVNYPATLIFLNLSHFSFLLSYILSTFVIKIYTYTI